MYKCFGEMWLVLVLCFDLPDFCDEVTPTWYNRLHRNMTKNDAYFVEKERNWSAIDNTYEKYSKSAKVIYAIHELDNY